MKNYIKCSDFEHSVNISSIEILPNLYLSISMRKNDRNGNGIEPTVTFEYLDNNRVIEFEPKHGPIKMMKKCMKDTSNALKHHLLDYIEDDVKWTQMDVVESGLKEAILKNNYEEVSLILQSYLKYIN